MEYRSQTLATTGFVPLKQYSSKIIMSLVLLVKTNTPFRTKTFRKHPLINYTEGLGDEAIIK